MSFQRGKFQTYRATTKIHLGKYELDIMADDQFDYDGYTVRYAGMEYGVTQLRGLVGDWFVPAQDTTTQYVSKPAGVEVSHATPEARERGDSFTMEEASEEEAVVGTMTEQKQIREAAAQGARGADRLAQLRQQRQQRKANIAKTGSAGGVGEVEMDSNPHAPPPENAADVDPEIEAALMEDAQANIADERQYRRAAPVHGDGAGSGMAQASPHEQEAVRRANEANLRALAEKREHLERVDPRKSREEMGGTLQDAPDAPGQSGRRVGGKFGLVVEDDGVEVATRYQFSGGATVGAEGTAGDAKRVNVMKAASTQPVQVGRAVAKTPDRRAANRRAGAEVIEDPNTIHEPQAVRAASTTQVQRRGNVSIDDVGPDGSTGDVSVAASGDDLADLLPDAAVAGRRAPTPPPPMSEDDEIAEIVEAWSTKRQWLKRVNEAVEYYGDWPEAIDAICDKETEKVAAQIRSRIAKAEAAASVQ